MNQKSFKLDIENNKQNYKNRAQIFNDAGIHAVIYRISKSKHSSNLILKGGFLIYNHFIVEYDRNTKDVDYLTIKKLTKIELHDFFEKIISEKTYDPIEFDKSTLKIEELSKPHSYRIKFKGYLEKTELPIQIDIGFGDIITPEPQSIIIPRLPKNYPELKLLGYPIYTTISEKIEGFIKDVLNNSRLKDLYDIYRLITNTHTIDIEFDLMAKALKETCSNRGTDIVGEILILDEAVLELNPKIGEGLLKFFEKPEKKDINIQNLFVALRLFFIPIIEHINSQNQKFSKWNPSNQSWE